MTVVDAIGQARLLMEKKTPARYWAGGIQYIVYIDEEREDGKFYFTGVEQGGTERIYGWDDAIRFRPIE